MRKQGFLPELEKQKTIYVHRYGLSISLIHCSDIHLDRNFNYGDPSRSDQRRKDVENNFVKTVDYALKEKPDIFLISGDVFDKVNPSNAARDFLVIQIKRLKDKDIPVFMIGGNHDVPKISNPYLAISVLDSAGLATVFSDSINFQEKSFSVGGETVKVIGKSYYTKNQSQNPFENFRIKKESKYLICLIHGSLVGLNVAPNNPHDSQYNPFGTSNIDSSIDYLALGHYHNFFVRKTETTICNPGSLETLNWAEINDKKGFVFAELNADETKTDFIPLETRKHKIIEITLDKTIPNVNELILNHIKQNENQDEILKVIVKGLISQEQQKTFKISQLARDSHNHCFHVDYDFPLEIEGFGRVFLGKMDNPIESFQKHLDNQIEKTIDPNEQSFLEKAKQRGVLYLEGNYDS